MHETSQLPSLRTSAAATWYRAVGLLLMWIPLPAGIVGWLWLRQFFDMLLSDLEVAEFATAFGILAFAPVLLGAALWPKGLALLTRARQIKASRRITHITPPYVLYLRAFSDDTITRRPLGTSEPYLRVLLSFIRVPLTEEEHLTRALKAIGNVVCAGRPDEPLPELGAQRVYLDNVNWKSDITRLMTEASLVLIRMAGGHSLTWELTTALSTVTPQRLVLLIPARLSYPEMSLGLSGATAAAPTERFMHTIESALRVRDLKVEDSLPPTWRGSVGHLLTFASESEVKVWALPERCPLAVYPLSRAFKAYFRVIDALANDRRQLMGWAFDSWSEARTVRRDLGRFQ